MMQNRNLHDPLNDRIFYVVVDSSVIFHQILEKTIKIGLPWEVIAEYAKVCFNWIQRGGYSPTLRDRPNLRTVWAIDSPPYWRHDYVEDYKSNRMRGMPDDPRKLVNVLQQTNLPIIGHPEFEADDIAGAIVQHLKGKDVHTLLLTCDSDWMGLVSEKVTFIETWGREPRVRTPMETYYWFLSNYNKSPKRIQKKFQFPPSYSDFHPKQIWEWKSIKGDSADNLSPGADLGLIDLLNPTVNVLKDPTFADYSLKSVLGYSKNVEKMGLSSSVEYEASLRSVGCLVPVPHVWIDRMLFIR